MLQVLSSIVTHSYVILVINSQHVYNQQIASNRTLALRVLADTAHHKIVNVEMYL